VSVEQFDPTDVMTVILKTSSSSKVSPVIGDGAFGFIFAIEDEQIVVKVIEDSLMNVCRESIGLDFLEGLGGFVPKRIPITGGIEKSCFFRTIAMERVGDANCNRGFYIRFARLVEAVKTLHDKGFIHRDL
jgi:hypothetical protein